MTKPTKILLGGLALAGAVVIAGFIYAARLEYESPQERHEAAAASAREADCLATEREKYAKAHGLDPKADVDIVGAFLESGGECLKGETTLATLVMQPAKARNAREVASGIAVLIALLSVVPWLWYFLLRRLAEVLAAIRGR